MSRPSRALPGEVVNPAPLGWRAGDRTGWRYIDEPPPVEVFSATVTVDGQPLGTWDTVVEFDPIN